MTLDAYRALFDLPPGMAYLDHAATGSLGRPALAATTGFLEGRAGLAPGRAPNNFPADLERIERCRARAAALVGAEASQVALVPNTSYGLNLVAQGLDWRPGDRVAVPACEFPSNLLPWRALEAQGVAVDRIPHCEGTFTPDDVADALTPRTRVVAVSAVQFLSGFRADLEAIGEVARQRGALFVVDAIQAVGALRLDARALGADLVAFGAHKWLGGMQGVGVAVLADSLTERLTPTRGWLNGPVDWDDFEASGLDLHADATRFHVGTMPTAAVYALDAALGALEAVGAEAVEAAVLANARHLAGGLASLGFERYGPAEVASGIVTVRADVPEALHAALAEAGVVASLRSRLLRFSPHAQTPPEALDRALSVLADAVGVGA